MARIIMHVDMDQFFVACEIKKNPSLKGKPVVVGSDPKGGLGRGVVSTASYEARKFGIKSATPISTAYKLNPEAIFLPVNFGLYRELSSKVMTIMRNHADQFEQTSIDEAYLDVSSALNFETALKIAERIQIEVRNEGLSCSIGVAENKSVAKIASDYQKPNGLTIVENAKEFMKDLPVRKVSGIGPRSEEALHSIGVRTIGELASTDIQKLMRVLGSYALYLQRIANGVDNNPVLQEEGVKSISRENTFEVDTDDPAVIEDVLAELSKELHAELMENKMLFKTVTIKIRFENFDTYSRAKTLNVYANDLNSIVRTAIKLYDQFEGAKLRLIGVRLSNLSRMNQTTLLDFI